MNAYLLKNIVKRNTPITALINLSFHLSYSLYVKTIAPRKHISQQFSKSIQCKQEKKVIHWTEKDRLTDSEILELSGISTNSKVTVNISEKIYPITIVDKKTKGYVFQTQINISDFQEGWYEISASNNDDSTARLYLHKVENLASVLITEDTYKNAQYSKETYASNQYARYLIKNYSPKGRYFYSIKDDAATYPLSSVSYDEKGIIVIPQPHSKERKKYYNPVTVAQHGLQLYYPSMEKDSEEFNLFINYAEWFVDNIQKDGSYRYNFLFYGGGYPLLPGWVSGMGQGQALSILSRAYHLTGNTRYLETGFKVLQFLLSPMTKKSNGCKCKLDFFTNLSPKLKRYSCLEICDEYPTVTPAFTLNGNLFCLIGLYDWASLSNEDYGSEQAREAFESGCKSIEVLLPYYDYGCYSSYDLIHWTYGFRPKFMSHYAHDCHIFLLHTLYEITGNEKFHVYYTRYLSYVSEPQDLVKKGNDNKIS